MFSIGNATNNYPLIYGISQYKSDLRLLQAIKSFFSCGNLVLSRNTYVFVVTSGSSINHSIIPFFEKHSLCSTKVFNFIKFRQVNFLKLQKKHLTESGRNEIEKLRVLLNPLPFDIAIESE
jgi:hypothetical protein